MEIVVVRSANETFRSVLAVFYSGLQCFCSEAPVSEHTALEALASRDKQAGPGVATFW